MTTPTPFAIGGALLGATLLAPFALPRACRVERSLVVQAPADALYALAASNEGYQRFNPFRTRDPELGAPAAVADPPEHQHLVPVLVSPPGARPTGDTRPATC